MFPPPPRLQRHINEEKTIIPRQIATKYNRNIFIESYTPVCGICWLYYATPEEVVTQGFYNEGIMKRYMELYNITTVSKATCQSSIPCLMYLRHCSGVALSM